MQLFNNKTFNKRSSIILGLLSTLAISSAYAINPKAGFTELPYRTIYIAKKSSNDNLYALINPLSDPLTNVSNPNTYPVSSKDILLTTGLDYALSQGTQTQDIPSIDPSTIPSFHNAPAFQWSFDDTDATNALVKDLHLTQTNTNINYSTYGYNAITIKSPSTVSFDPSNEKACIQEKYGTINQESWICTLTLKSTVTSPTPVNTYYTLPIHIVSYTLSTEAWTNTQPYPSLIPVLPTVLAQRALATTPTNLPCAGAKNPYVCPVAINASTTVDLSKFFYPLNTDVPVTYNFDGSNVGGTTADGIRQIAFIGSSTAAPKTIDPTSITGLTIDPATHVLTIPAGLTATPGMYQINIKANLTSTSADDTTTQVGASHYVTFYINVGDTNFFNNQTINAIHTVIADGHKDTAEDQIKTFANTINVVNKNYLKKNNQLNYIQASIGEPTFRATWTTQAIKQPYTYQAADCGYNADHTGGINAYASCPFWAMNLQGNATLNPTYVADMKQCNVSSTTPNITQLQCLLTASMHASWSRMPMIMQKDQDNLNTLLGLSGYVSDNPGVNTSARNIANLYTKDFITTDPNTASTNTNTSFTKILLNFDAPKADSTVGVLGLNAAMPAMNAVQMNLLAEAYASATAISNDHVPTQSNDSNATPIVGLTVHLNQDAGSDYDPTVQANHVSVNNYFYKNLADRLAFNGKILGITGEASKQFGPSTLAAMGPNGLAFFTTYNNSTNYRAPNLGFSTSNSAPYNNTLLAYLNIPNAPTLNNFGKTDSNFASLTFLGFGSAYNMSNDQGSFFGNFIASDQNCSINTTVSSNNFLIAGTPGPCNDSIYDAYFNNYAQFNTPIYTNALSSKSLFATLGAQYVITLPIAGSVTQTPYSASIQTPLSSGAPTGLDGNFSHAPIYMAPKLDFSSNPTTSELTQLFGTMETGENAAGQNVINTFEDFHACPLIDDNGNLIDTNTASGDGSYNTNDYLNCVVTSSPLIAIRTPIFTATANNFITSGYRFATQQDYMNLDNVIYQPQVSTNNTIKKAIQLGSITPSMARGISLSHLTLGGFSDNDCALRATNSNPLKPYSNCSFPNDVGLSGSAASTAKPLTDIDGFYTAFEYSLKLGLSTNQNGDPLYPSLNPNNKVQQLVNIDDIYYSINNRIADLNNALGITSSSVESISWPDAGLSWSGFSLGSTGLPAAGTTATFSANAALPDGGAITYDCIVLNHRNIKSTSKCEVEPLTQGQTVGTIKIDSFDQDNVDPSTTKGDKDLSKYGDWAVQIIAHATDNSAITASSVVMPFTEAANGTVGDEKLIWTDAQYSVKIPYGMDSTGKLSGATVYTNAQLLNLKPGDTVTYTCSVHTADTAHTLVPNTTCSFPNVAQINSPLTITGLDPSTAYALQFTANIRTNTHSKSTSDITPISFYVNLPATPATETISWEDYANQANIPATYSGTTLTGTLNADAILLLPQVGDTIQYGCAALDANGGYIPDARCTVQSATTNLHAVYATGLPINKEPIKIHFSASVSRAGSTVPRSEVDWVTFDKDTQGE